MSARLRIREQAYHGLAGFAVAGQDSLGRQISIWCHFRDTAEKIKALVRAGRDEAALSELLRIDALRASGQAISGRRRWTFRVTDKVVCGADLSESQARHYLADHLRSTPNDFSQQAELVSIEAYDV